MRYIDKSGPVPDCLQNFINDQLNVEGGPTNLHYNNFPKKAELTRVLVAEQKGICGYTGRYMDSVNWHNEHVFPQSLCRNAVKNAGREVGKEVCCDLHYNNIIAAIKVDGAKPYGATARTPGVLLPINPMQQDCENRFLYTETGEIIPAEKDDIEALDTIKELSLNDKGLLDLRFGRLQAIVADGFLLEVTKSELEKIIADCDALDDSGWLPEFAFVTKSVALNALPFALE